MKRFKHGMSGTRFYKIWNDMLTRCYRNKSRSYQWYGARGITTCEEWKIFKNFMHDMYGNYEEHLTLDRIDNNKGYYKENCRWITKQEQNNNHRRNRNVTYKGKTMNVKQWSEELGLSYRSLLSRIYDYKWSIEKSFTTPMQKHSFRKEGQNPKLIINGKKMSLNEASKYTGICVSTLRSRIYRGWSNNDIVNTPIKPSQS